MLNLPRHAVSASFPAQSHEDEAGLALNFDWLLSAARRQMWLVAGFAVLGAIIGVVAIATTVPLYTASIDILIDKARSRVIDEITATGGPMQDEAETLSQVELLRSEQLSRSVISELSLTDNAVFMADNPSILSYVSGFANGLIADAGNAISGEPIAFEQTGTRDEARLEQAIEILQANVNVSRVGRTYVLRLYYTSPDRHLSARIAQAFGDAYLNDQLESKYDATRRASSWLQDRMAELKEQSFQADMKVQAFRTENRLISSGGRLVAEQQLSEVNTQLVVAQAATAEARARLEQIETLIEKGQTDAVVNDALVSTTINTLRSRYLDTSRLKAEIEAKLGPTHSQVVRLRDELAELERLIFGELRRIAESYRSSYNVALSRQQSLETSLAAIESVNAEANTTQVGLRELEREAESFKTLYESFLKRYQETIQQQSFPISNARVIKPATDPSSASSPRKTRTLLAFLMLGAMAGVGIGTLREYRDRFFRTGDHVRNELGVEFLGFTSKISRRDVRGSARGGGPAQPGAGLWRKGSVNGYVAGHPLSGFAETLRNVKVATDLGLPDTKGKIIGILSCLPGEGKSTISASFATLLTMQGMRVALIDGDFRNPGLTRNLAFRPSNGMIEVLTSPDMSIDSILQWDATGKLAVAPTVQKQRISNTSELLASPQMAELLSGMRDTFDYIIVDLPPVGPVVDAKAFAHRTDGFVFVVEWGRTSRQLVRSMMSNNPLFYEKCLGVLLNKFDEQKSKLYRSYGSPEYYASRYQSYYHQ